MKKVLFLASGRGSNFQSFVDHLRLGVLKNIVIAGLVCNRRGALVLDLARKSTIPTFEIEGTAGKVFASKVERERARRAFDEKCLALVEQLGIEYILLAGFDQILSKVFVSRRPNGILNIHPAYDLKRFGGSNMVGESVHEAVIHAGVKFSGCTVHIVSNEVDQGPVILKQKVRVDPIDTPSTLAQRILDYEHVIYPKALQLLADGRVSFVTGGRCFVDMYSDNWDLEWTERQESYLEFIGKEQIPVHG